MDERDRPVPADRHSVRLCGAVDPRRRHPLHARVAPCCERRRSPGDSAAVPHRAGRGVPRGMGAGQRPHRVLRRQGARRRPGRADRRHGAAVRAADGSAGLAGGRRRRRPAHCRHRRRQPAAVARQPGTHGRGRGLRGAAGPPSLPRRRVARPRPPHPGGGRPLRAHPTGLPARRDLTVVGLRALRRPRCARDRGQALPVAPPRHPTARHRGPVDLVAGHRPRVHGLVGPARQGGRPQRPGPAQGRAAGRGRPAQLRGRPGRRDRPRCPHRHHRLRSRPPLRPPRPRHRLEAAEAAFPGRRAARGRDLPRHRRCRGDARLCRARRPRRRRGAG